LSTGISLAPLLPRPIALLRNQSLFIKESF